MAIIGFNESTLASSEVFNGIRETSKESSQPDPIDKAIKLIKTTKPLTKEDIEAAYISVYHVTDSLTRTAIKAFDMGKIVLIYNTVPAESVTQALPFITFKTPQGFITYVFMDRFVTSTRDGILNVQVPILRDLLVGALVANSLKSKSNYDALASNQFLQRLLMEVYTKFVCRILNIEFSIGAEKVIYDTVQYWINKFFLLRIIQASDSPENIEVISSKHFKHIDEMRFEEIKNSYDQTNPMKISELLELIKTASPRMKTLGLGSFLSNWIKYYHVASMLAVDNIEYLIFMVLTLLNANGSIVSISAVEMVRDVKNIKTLKEEVLKLV